MTPYKAVLFDFDFTLADASKGILACISSALRQMGLPIPDRQAMLHTVGLSLKETFFSLTGIREEERASRFSELFVLRSDEIMVENTVLYPDALPTLRALRERGFGLGIVTTKYHRRIQAVFGREYALGLFDAILGGDDVSEPKPDPEGLCRALKMMNLAPAQALYVGDSTVDAKTAECAGVPFAGVTTGATTKQQLEAYPNTGVYKNLRELAIQAGFLTDRMVKTDG